MNHESLRIKITHDLKEILDNPQKLWHRLFNLKLCLVNPRESQVVLQNSLFIITLNFQSSAPLCLDVYYSIKNTKTKESIQYQHGRLNDPNCFIQEVEKSLQNQITEVLFLPQVDWEFLTKEELQTLVVPKIRKIKETIRNFKDTDAVFDQILIENQLLEIKDKLTHLLDPESKQYAELIDLLET